MTFFSKLKKSPTPQHLEYRYIQYAPVEVTAEQMASAMAESRELRDLVSAQEYRQSIETTLDERRRQKRAHYDKLGILKHGPMGSGDTGPCDPDCRKCAAEAIAKVDQSLRPAAFAVEPLDCMYDGVSLRWLLTMDERKRREVVVGAIITPTQRAAISAHWSAELRAKVAASKERDRNVVRVDLQDEP